MQKQVSDPTKAMLAALLLSGAWAVAAVAASPAGGSASGLNTVGTPAVDFSPGGGGVTGVGGVQGDGAVYVWVDSSGVMHFTDQTGEFLGRFRDRFQPIDLFVNSVGQPKR